MLHLQGSSGREHMHHLFSEEGWKNINEDIF